MYVNYIVHKIVVTINQSYVLCLTLLLIKAEAINRLNSQFDKMEVFNKNKLNTLYLNIYFKKTKK